MHLKLYLIILVFFALTVIGCSNPINNLEQKDIAPEKNIESNNPTSKGQVKITNSFEKAIPDEIGKVIASFFSIYYESISELEEKDLTSLFDLSSPASIDNANINQASLSYLIGHRKIQPNDLKLTKYSYQIDYLYKKALNGDIIEMLLHEHSKIYFNFIPNIESITSSVDHKFTMVSGTDGWKIQKHRKSEDVYNLIQDEYRARKNNQDLTPDMSKDLIANITQDLIKQSELKTLERLESKEQYLANPEINKNVNKKWKHNYDRNKAVAYASKWVSPDRALRNPKWFVYDDMGGNCNNYISQCLFAGGIPMDIYGPMDFQWKWYSDMVNPKQVSRGRAPAWTGVNEFYTYCRKNTGFGLVSSADSNFYSGEKGDIIFYGTEDNWHHAVIITDIVKDNKGHPIDYLINSNTTDRINYPVSAYSYSNMRLVKVLGWND